MMRTMKSGLMSVLDAMRDAAVNAVVPPGCLSCDAGVTRPGALCATCWSEVRFLAPPMCQVTGIPFAYDIEALLSAQAIANPPPYATARAAVAYDGIPRKLVQILKFGDRTDLAPHLAAWMARAGADMLRPDDAVIVPVPLHRARLLKRRFNQSAELARHVARIGQRKFLPLTLTRIRSTRQQVGLGARERHENVRGAFRVGAGDEIAVAGRPVILVDDVLTTGATLEACTRALLRAGAARVDCLTFARVLHE